MRISRVCLGRDLILVLLMASFCPIGLCQDEHDREVVLMRHFEQLSNQDVARSLGLTEPAASMRYLRAIRKLRSLLATPTDESQLL